MKLIVDMPMPKDCPQCPMAHYNKLDEWRHDDSSPMWLPCMERETLDDWVCADGKRSEHETTVD